MKKSGASKNYRSRTRSWFIIISLVVFGFLSICLAPVLFFPALFFFLVLLVIIESPGQVSVVEQGRYHQKPMNSMKLNVSSKAKRKAQANVMAQLLKPDFETRLQNYVSAGGEYPVEPEEEFVSQAKFWRLENYTYEQTPARPVELLRQLLHRISKLVGRS